MNDMYVIMVLYSVVSLPYLFIGPPPSLIPFTCFHSSAFSRTSHSRNHTVRSLFGWLLALSDMLLRFLHVFPWRGSAFFFSVG